MANEKLIFDLVVGRDGLNPALKSSQKNTDRLSSSIQNLGTRLTDASKGAFAIGSALASAAAGFAGFRAVKVASQIEDLTTRFEVLTGSAGEASGLLQELQEFAAKTPFRLEGIAETSAQLLSFGIESDQIRERLQRIGDVAAASGARLQDVGLIFGQVAAAGKLTGERLLQLQERGIPVLAALADQLGVTQAAARELITKGAVDFKTFERAFDSLSERGGFAFEGLIRRSQTFSGVISTLSDAVDLRLGQIGQALLPVLKEIGIATIEFINNLDVSAIVEFVQDGIQFLTDNLDSLITAVKFAGLALAGFGAVIGALRIATFVTAIGQLAASFSLLGGILGGAAFIALNKFFEKLVDIFNIVRRLESPIQAIGIAFARFFRQIQISVLDALIDRLIKVVEFAADIGDAVGIGSEKLRDFARQAEAFRTDKIKEFRQDLEISKDSITDLFVEANRRRVDLSQSIVGVEQVDRNLKKVTSTLRDLKKEGRGAEIKVSARDAAKELQNSLRDAINNVGKFLVDTVSVVFPQAIGNIKLSASQQKALAAGLGLTATALRGRAGARQLISGGGGAAVGAFTGSREAGQAAGQILNVLQEGPEAVRATIREFVQAIPELVENIILSLPVVIEEFANGIPVIIDRLAERSDEIVIALARSMPTVARALALSAPDIVFAIIRNLPDLFNALTVGFVKVFRDGGEEFFKKVAEAGERLVSDLVNGAGVFGKKLLEEITGTGGGGPLGKVGGTARNIVDTVTAPVRKVFGFAEGGQGFVQRVPTGFPNDTFPARLTSGELVVDRSTAQDLRTFLNNQRAPQDNAPVVALLSQIASSLDQPMTVQSQVTLDQQTFADIILELNRSNQRLA